MQNVRAIDLKDRCIKYWNSITDEVAVASAVHKFLKSKKAYYSHKKLIEGLKRVFDNSASTKRGSYFEYVIYLLLLEYSNAQILYSKADEDTPSKLSTDVSKELYDMVDNYIIQFKMGKLDISTFEGIDNMYRTLHKAAYEASIDDCDYYYSSKLDLDIGFKLPNTNKVFFLEIKSDGEALTQGDFSDHFRRHLLKYVSYVYWNKPEYDDFECSFLLISNDILNQFKKISHSKNGLWFLEDFANLIEVNISEETAIELFYICSQIDDDAVEIPLKNYLNLASKYSNIRNMSVKEMLKSYKSYYCE